MCVVKVGRNTSHNADLAPAPLTYYPVTSLSTQTLGHRSRERRNEGIQKREEDKEKLYCCSSVVTLTFFSSSLQPQKCIHAISWIVIMTRRRQGRGKARQLFFSAGIEEGGRTYPLPSFQSPSSIHLPIPIFCPETRWGGNLLGWREREIKHQMNIFLWGKSQAGITVAGKNIKNSDQETSQLTSKRLPTT